MLGLINNLAFPELVIIAIIAILIFGRRLPQVVGQGAAHLGRARRTLESLWRETGIEKEVRDVQREIERIERKVPRNLTPSALAKRATEKLWKDAGEEQNPKERAEQDTDEADAIVVDVLSPDDTANDSPGPARPDAANSEDESNETKARPVHEEHPGQSSDT
jgi:Sec-independent protein translocase protein TatA